MSGRAGPLTCVRRAFRAASRLFLAALMPSLSLVSRGRCFGTGSVSRTGLELQRADVLALWDDFRFIMGEWRDGSVYKETSRPSGPLVEAGRANACAGPRQWLRIGRGRIGL